MANAGHVVGTERLLTHVWGHRGSGDRQLLKQLVHRLRQKIEDDPADAAAPAHGVGSGLRAAGLVRAATRIALWPAQQIPRSQR